MRRSSADPAGRLGGLGNVHDAFRGRRTGEGGASRRARGTGTERGSLCERGGEIGVSVGNAERRRLCIWRRGTSGERGRGCGGVEPLAVLVLFTVVPARTCGGRLRVCTGEVVNVLVLLFVIGFVVFVVVVLQLATEPA